MNRFFKRATIAVASVALIGSAVATSIVRAADEATTATAKIGQPAPQFTLEDQNGKKVSLSDYAGKIVVLEWTNPGCPVVQRHYKAKTMTALQKEFAKQNVVWLAINSTHDVTNSVDLTWAKEQGISYPILNDASGETGHAYHATNTPEMYIIDKSGKLVYEGGIDNDPQGDLSSGKVNYVAQALDEVLAGKPVSTSEAKAYGCAVHYSK
jgi:peroxiredoxin